MGLLQRAVAACERAMRQGRASERLIRDVLKYEDKSIDVSCIEPFLCHESLMVRRMAARIVGARGSVDALIAAALKEKNKTVLVEMMRCLGGRGGGVVALERLLADKDSFVRNEAVEMFRRAGEVDSLFPLLFDGDDRLVERIRRYLNEKT